MNPNTSSCHMYLRCTYYTNRMNLQDTCTIKVQEF
nr:MAG TPA: hypothetical protein [Caudoviricetes sp.]